MLFYIYITLHVQMCLIVEIRRKQHHSTQPAIMISSDDEQGTATGHLPKTCVSASCSVENKLQTASPDSVLHLIGVLKSSNVRS